MRLRHAYLILCVVGTLLPYSQFVPWFLRHGLDLSLFFHQLFANPVSSFFGLDVIVSAIALWVFVLVEGARLRMRLQLLLLPILASLLVGVSLGLPLFLYLRQRHLDAAIGA